MKKTHNHIKGCILLVLAILCGMGQVWGQNTEEWSGTVGAKTYSTANLTTTITITGDVTLTGEITVSKGEVIIQTDGSNRMISRKYASSGCDFIMLKQTGGTVRLKGNGATLTIDGAARFATPFDASTSMTHPGYYDGNMIYTYDGHLYLTDVILQNGYNSDGPGAIRVGTSKITNGPFDFHLTNVIIRGFCGRVGAAILFVSSQGDNSGNQNARLTNVEVYGCYSTGASSNGTVSNYGGTIVATADANSDVVLDNCYIHDNKANYYGAGVHWLATQTRSLLTIQNNTRICNNTAKSGGGLMIRGGTVTINSSDINGNTASNETAGGGICVLTGTLNITNGTQIYNNTAKSGGGLMINGGTVTINSSDIYGNTASAETAGGGICVLKGTLNITNGTQIYNNTAKSGGGLMINGGTVTINSSDIYGNTASNETAGGGICVLKGTLNITNGTQIRNNTASKSDGRGGGIYLQGSSTVNFQDSYITNNQAGRGAGIYLLSDATLNLLSGSITGNNATETNLAGGIHLANGHTYTVNVGATGSGPLVIKNNTFGSSNTQCDIFLQKKEDDNSTRYYINVSGDNFNPQDMGIYTENTSTDVPVFYNSNGDYLANIYNNIATGTTNVFPNRTNYRVKEYNDSGSTVKKFIYFTKTGVTSPWSAVQQTATPADNLHLVDGVYEIYNVEDLTAFLWHVNGITTHGDFGSGDPAAKGKLMANIDMDGHYWVPIGINYTGTFDGNGYYISNLTMDRNNMSNKRGLFGSIAAGAVIKNVQLHNCSFTSGQATYMGLVASELNGGVILNCNVDGSLVGSSQPTIMGGLVGKMAGGEAHSSCAYPVFNGGSTMGGLVGEMTSGTNLKNSFVNPQFISSDGGGLVGSNAGAVENCYVLGGATSFTGEGTGTVDYCYAPAVSSSGTNGTFDPVVKPYVYALVDNQVSATNSYVPTGSNKSLLQTLNNWVGSSSTYSPWVRTTTTTINGDYPVLKMNDFEAVAGDGSKLYYGMATNNGLNNNMITTHTAPDEAVCIYKSTNNVVSNSTSEAALYIDEDAAITQAGTLTANVGVTLKNTQNSTNSWDWHMFSPALSKAPLGINYIVSGTNENVNNIAYQYAYMSDPPHYTFTGLGYFPTAADEYYREWDYYCYYEPQYHWINFKRNGISHWHEDEPHNHIDYVGDAANVNETNMKPGKGYLLATKRETLLQAGGSLNNSDISITITTDGPYRTGYNLIGNPFQSYYDFNTFASDNASLWGGIGNASYILLSGDAYTVYAYNASNNTLMAPRWLHPHQGFMIVASNSGTATFYNSNRIVEGQSEFRSEPQPNYALINLIATGEDGNRDITTVELNRPDKGGAVKAYDLHLGKGCIYTHYEDEDYSIAFTQPGITEVGVRFEADEEATFTMTWDMENGDFSYLHLIDNKTGIDTDCLSSSEYRFTASPDDYKSRFKLVFEYTGIEENDEEDEVSAGAETFAFVMGDALVVNGEGILQLFEVTGRKVLEQAVSGTQTTMALPKMASGVYVARLKGVKGIQTQKIVIER